jgi:tripartite-type tricarboxylate transporter receptor subunit TctC
MTILTLDLRRAAPPGSGSKGAGCLGFGARLKRASVAFATLLSMLFIATSAYAWPERPVTVIVPYAAGGNTDIMARMASEWLSVQLKQRFVVENRAGAGGTLATAFVAQSKPDGYTLLFGAAPQLLIAPLVQKVAYDARKDFAPVAVFGTGPHVMAVHASVPGKTIREFIDYAKANPGKVNYASGGQGTSGHLHAALFASRAGLDMVHVPYRGGAPATADVLAGQVQIYFGNAAELLPHMGSDKIRLILVSSAARMPQLPDVPTFEELFPGVRLSVWNGFLAPAATPNPVLEILAKETAAATKNPAIVQRLSELGIEPGGLMLDDFQKDIDQSRGAFEDAVKAAGLKPM